MNKYFLLSLLLTLTLAFRAQTQDMTRARQTITDMTAPAMHGRGYVQEGDKRAAAYLRQRFRDLGLQALSPDYYQSFSLPVNRFPGNLSLQVDRVKLVPGRDFIAHATSGAGSLTGKVLVLDTLVFPQPEAGQKFFRKKMDRKVLVLPGKFYAQLHRLPEVWRRKMGSVKAVVLLQPGKLTASVAAHQAPWPVLEVRLSSWPVGARFVSLAIDAILEPYTTQNVLAFIPGSVRPDSFLVVSAHYDHLGRQGRDLLFPGANDNASGTAMLLELAAWYAQPANRPRCSIAFMAFGAEEAGLVGSEYYTSHPLFPLTSIRFLLNLDLLGAGEEGLMVVNGRILEKEFRLLTHLNEQHSYFTQIRSRGKAANSDHHYFTEKGVPSFFFYTLGGTNAYHDPDDVAATLPLSHFQELFLLITAFLPAL